MSQETPISFQAETGCKTDIFLFDLSVLMKHIGFAWDENKAKKNFKKHGVSFEEAQSVFFDEYAVQFWDEEHSALEDRLLMLGMSSRLRLLLVIHCYREENSIIRIISAREATRREQLEYSRD